MRTEHELSEFYCYMHPMRVFLLVTTDERGNPNVMALAWATPVSSEPPLLAIAVAKENYSHDLLRKRKEFVLAVPTLEQLEIVWAAGTRSGREYDKAKALGLEFVPSSAVGVPSIKGCVANIECRVKQEVDCGECTLFIAEVLAVTYDEKAFYRRRARLAQAKLLAHVGGNEFAVFQARTYRASLSEALKAKLEEARKHGA